MLNLVWPMLMFCTISAVVSYIGSWLSTSLSSATQNDLTSAYFDKKAFYGIKFIDTKGKTANPSEVLSSDLLNISGTSVNFLYSLTRAIMNFGIGIYKLYYKSYPLALNLLGFSVCIPMYMVFAALAYSAVYSYITRYFEAKINQYQTKIDKDRNKIRERIHHVDGNAESIALKKGGDKEKSFLIKKYQKISNYESNRRIMSGVLEFIQTAHFFLSYLSGILLSVPQIISGVMKGSEVFGISSYFTSVLNLFTWKKDNTYQIHSLHNSLNRYSEISDLIKQWETIEAQNHLTIMLEEGKLGVNNLTISKPSGDPILEKATFELPIGKATIIQGKSGIGKTTLFRTLAQLWPYTTGEIILPKMVGELKLYYVPQRPFIPLRCTLLESILYPLDMPQNDGIKIRIKEFMKALNFRSETIENLEKKDSWGKVLSGGEQQRIAIIGAIISQPDILFMDEGTSALDSHNKGIAEQLFKEHLGGTTIVTIDHHASQQSPQTPFYNHKIEIMRSLDSDSEAPKTIVTSSPFA